MNPELLDTQSKNKSIIEYHTCHNIYMYMIKPQLSWLKLNLHFLSLLSMVFSGFPTVSNARLERGGAVEIRDRGA